MSRKARTALRGHGFRRRLGSPRTCLPVGSAGDSLAPSGRVAGRVAAGPGQRPLERAVRFWTQARRHIQWRMRLAIEDLSTESTSSVLQGREVDCGVAFRRCRCGYRRREAAVVTLVDAADCGRDPLDRDRGCGVAVLAVAAAGP